MDCGPTQCTYIACTVGPLKKREDVVFRIKSRLWTSTLAKLTHHKYEISSRLVAQVSELPHKVDPSYLGVKTFTVTTRVVSLQDFGEAGEVPFWILLLAILAGLIFLAIVCFCLWHFGFFRRQRPSADTLQSDAPQEGVVLLHNAKQPSAKIAQTSFSVPQGANNQFRQSMPGNSASICLRNSQNSTDYQSLLPYPEGLLLPGDEAL